MYGVDGVNNGFEFDGTVFVKINTGMATDAPAWWICSAKSMADVVLPEPPLGLAKVMVNMACLSFGGIVGANIKNNIKINFNTNVNVEINIGVKNGAKPVTQRKC